MNKQPQMVPGTAPCLQKHAAAVTAIPGEPSRRKKCLKSQKIFLKRQKNTGRMYVNVPLYQK